MKFQQEWFLWALPLIALPVIIHLINQRRFQSIRWAAMMFLLAANRMSRGYSRLRRWLILLFRALAVAGLVFAISRPLASGWLGSAGGGRVDTTIILLDRSPSMQQRGADSGTSKLQTGQIQLVETLQTLGSTKWVLIESTANQPRELESPASLLKLTTTGPSSAAADLPAMLQSAHDYIQANHTGQTEIWICSDVRENDWNAESGRWKSLRDAFLEFSQGVRFHLLAYSQESPGNLSVRVTGVRRQTTSDGAELLVSLQLSREGNTDGKVTVPVQFEIEGARSVVTLEMSGPKYELKDHRIPLERTRERGWGKVSIPADMNPADDDFYFVFSDPVPSRTIIVADDPQSERPLQLAAAIAPNPSLKCTAEVVTLEGLATVDWENVSLLLWQSQLPQGDSAILVEAFILRGGQAIFLPPQTPGTQELFGVRWEAWAEGGENLPVENWRGDQDLLAHTISGTALPVGSLQVGRYCTMKGEFTPLATLRGGTPLLVRVPTKRGGVYFCATTPDPGHSSLATSGVVLYAMIQRALAAGSADLGNTRQLLAGNVSINPATWKRLASSEEGYSVEYPFHRGVYTAADKLLAVNRPNSEDQAAVLAAPRVNELFTGLDFVRVDDKAGNLGSLIQELWRLFLATMMVAMVVEAALCLPKVARAAGSAA